MGAFGDALQTQAGQAAGQVAGGVLAGMWGNIMANWNDRRQLKQQARLQDLQIQGTEKLQDYQYQKQLQMWKDTNYPAQMTMLKEAGLNPGLIYGMGGGGGTTTGSAGPSVTGAQAPSGGNEKTMMTAMGIQSARETALLQGQLKVMESEANKNNAEADATRGYKKENTEANTLNLLQGVENLKAQEALTKIQTDNQALDLKLKQGTIDDNIKLVEAQRQAAEETVHALARENKINDETMNTKIDTIKADLAARLITNLMTQQSINESKSRQNLNYAEAENVKTQSALNQSNIEVNQATIRNMIVTQSQNWQRINIEGYNANTNRQNANTNQKQQELNKFIHDLKDSTKFDLDVSNSVLDKIFKACGIFALAL